jgi:hypothetical protein
MNFGGRLTTWLLSLLLAVTLIGLSRTLKNQKRQKRKRRDRRGRRSMSEERIRTQKYLRFSLNKRKQW